MVILCPLSFGDNKSRGGRRQIMVIPHTFSPSRGSRVRWHAETNHGHSVPCRPGSIVFKNAQRQIMVIVATCPFAGERRRRSRVCFPKEERCAESPPTIICGKRRKNRRKPVKLKILSLGVVFTLEEGISTSHVCLKGQQPIF